MLCFWISFSATAAEKAKIDIRVEEKGEAQFNTTAQAQVLVPSQIPGFAQSVPELLERGAGVQLKSYGGLDDFSTLSIRGSTTEEVLIYLDGVLLNSAQGGMVDLSFLPLDNIEKIEIYRGGSPGKIVDSTPGGVIYIHTKGKPDETENRLRNSVGSFYTYRGHLQRTQALGNFYYLASFDYFRSRGNFPYLDDRGTRTNKSDDRFVNRQNNDFAAYDFTGIAGEETKGPLSWKVFENFFLKDQGIPGLGSFLSAHSRLRTLQNFIHGKLKNKPASEKGFGWETDLFFDYLNSQFTDPLGEIGLGVQDNDDTTFRLGPEFRWQYPFDTHQIWSGFLAYRGEFYFPTNHTVTPAAGPSSHRHMIGVGAENELHFLNDKVILDPSLRLQIFLNDLSGAPANTVTNTELSAKFGLKIAPWHFLNFRANVYRGFRQPTFGELFGDRGTFVGNPSLKPEKGLNFDFGLAAQGSNMGVLDDFKLEAIYFRQMTDDLIQFLQTSQFTAKAQNLNSATITGGEFSASLRWFKNLRWSAHYVYQSAKDTSEASPTRGKFLPGRPKNQVYTEGGYRYRIVEPFVEMQYLSDNYLDSQNLLRVNHRTLLALGLHLTPWKVAKITFTTKNLLNEQTVDIAGFPLPGRSYWGELELKL